MELFPPLTKFYSTIEKDARINTTHISLYMALLQQWNLNGGVNPFQIERGVIMSAAKINARHTYNKCINNLHDFGYISYVPSSNSFSSSKIYLMELKIII